MAPRTTATTVTGAKCMWRNTHMPAYTKCVWATPAQAANALNLTFFRCTSAIFFTRFRRFFIYSRHIWLIRGLSLHLRRDGAVLSVTGMKGTWVCWCHYQKNANVAPERIRDVHTHALEAELSWAHAKQWHTGLLRLYAKNNNNNKNKDNNYAKKYDNVACPFNMLCSATPYTTRRRRRVEFTSWSLLALLFCRLLSRVNNNSASPARISIEDWVSILHWASSSSSSSYPAPCS